MYNKRKIGNEKERLAGEFLKEQGYHILEYNFYCKSGEIDIVAREAGYLAFVEVKYRRSDKNGMPEEAVDYKKMLHLTRTAQYYMICKGLAEDTPCRFDVVTVMNGRCTLYRDAFEAVM